MKHNNETEQIMKERFGKDSIIALATVKNGLPQVRNVDAYYENGSFYVLTYALSNKIQEINIDNSVAIAGEWFTAHGKGINLGYFEIPQNKEIANKLRDAFSSWIDNGHNDFNDVNTIILEIKLKDAILFSNNKRYDIEF
jgi:general stress protein 26